MPDDNHEVLKAILEVQKTANITQSDVSLIKQKVEGIEGMRVSKTCLLKNY